MPSHSWADDEQTDFLKSYFEKYYELQKTGKYSDFWPTIFEAWFSRWPMISVIFPEKLITDLDDEEREELKREIKRTKTVCF
jgi:hypothetical protein